MKSILITNVSKFDLDSLGQFIEDHGLFNVSVLLEPEHFTATIEQFLARYSLNVVIPLECVEEGHNSLAAVEARNPGIEQRILAYPPHKIKIIRYARRNPGYKSVIALAMTFPKVEVVMARGDLVDSYHNQDSDMVFADEAANGKAGRIVVTNNPFQDYQMIDLGLLFKLKIVKEKSQCLSIKMVE